MSAIDTLRDALFGNPPSPTREPSREGVLSAFTQLFDAAVVAQYAAVAGLTTVSDTAARDAFYATPANRGKLVYVNNNGGSASDPANGVYEYVGGSARLAAGFYQGVAAVVQPLVDEADEAADRAAASAIEANAYADSLSSDAIEAIGRPLGVALVNGQPDQAAQAYFLDRVVHAGTLAAIDIYDRAAGTLQVAVFRGAGSSLTRVGLTTAQTQGGGVSRTIALAVALPVQAGDVLAVRAATTGLYAYVEAGADGAGYYLGPQQPMPETVTLGGATTNIVLQIRFRVAYRQQVVTAAAFADVTEQLEGFYADEPSFIGRPETAPIVAADPAQGAQCYFLDAVQEAGRFASIDVYDRAVGTIEAAAFRNVSGTWTRIGLSSIATQGGNVVRNLPVADPIAVDPGDIICIRATADGLFSFKAGLPVDGMGYYFGPIAPIPATTTIGQPVASGLIYARIHILSRVKVVSAERILDLEAEVKGIGQAGGGRVPLAAALRPALLSSGARVGVVTYGQSNSTGYAAQLARSLTQPYANLTFAGGVASGRAGNTYGAVNNSPGMSATKPLVEQNSTSGSPGADGSEVNGETMCTAAASTLVELAAVEAGFAPGSFSVFASVAGHAGYSIAQLSKGSPWYGSVIDHITRQAQLSASAGKRYTLPCIPFIQGADDARDGRSTAYWRDAFLQLVADVNADGLAAINTAMTSAGLPTQTAPIHFLLFQTASPYFEGTRENLALIRQAQYECVALSPLVHFAMPEASLPAKVGDFLHYTPISQVRAGRHVGRMMAQMIVDGCEPDCVWPLSAIGAGTTITIRFRVPTLPLVLDQATYGTLTDKGFKVTDASGTVPITGVAVSKRGDAVEITLGRALDANAVVRNGLDYIGSTNNHLQSANGCLRDSTRDTTTIDGTDYPLWHVAPCFALAVATLAAGAITTA